MVQESSKLIFTCTYVCFACMAKIADNKSLMNTNITILVLQKKKKLMDSVNVQIYKIDIGKLIFLKKNIDFDRNIKKIILYL